MANYVGRFRTNYFKVNDEKAFDKWLTTYLADAEKITKKDRVGFLSYDSFEFYDPDGNEEIDEDVAFQELQDLLCDGEACVVHEIGYEKFRYFVSGGTIITKSTINFFSFEDFLLEKVKEMTGNKEFNLNISY